MTLSDAAGWVVVRRRHRSPIADLGGVPAFATVHVYRKNQDGRCERRSGPSSRVHGTAC